MFAKLTGIIDSIDDGSVIIDVGGVGYEVFCAPRTVARLAVGEAAQLSIETHVREDHIHLFGFADAVEREWFRTLMSVQRVGAKMALMILDALPIESIARAILAKDTTAFSRISGVGPKLAERIVVDLRDKVGKMPVGGGQGAGVRDQKKEAGKKKSTDPRPPTPDFSAIEDTISALTHMGYGRSEAYGAALKVSAELGGDAEIDALIKHSLKELAG